MSTAVAPQSSGNGPSPETTIAILTGASEWPRANLSPNDAYLKSCQDFREYLLDDYSLERRNLLNLFDANDTSQQLLTQIRTFIDERREAQIADVVFYYVGHGVITDDTREFYLPIRSTDKNIEVASSLGMNAVAGVLREKARFMRQYVVLDCCFSAAAWKSFQSSPGGVAAQWALESLRSGLPTRGVTLLCSSGPRDPSRIPKGGTRTMFTEAMLGALKAGNPNGSTRLSFADVKNLAERIIKKNWPDEAVRPEIHSPSAREGDLREVPFFPNPAAVTRGPSGTGRDVASRSPGDGRWDAVSAINRALLRGSGSFAIRTRMDPQTPHRIEFSLLCLHRDDLIKVYDRVARLIDHKDALGAGIFAAENYRITNVPENDWTKFHSNLTRRKESDKGERAVEPPASTAAHGTISLVATLEIPGLLSGTPLEAAFHIRTLFEDLLYEMDRDIRLMAAGNDGEAAVRILAHAESYLSPLRTLLSGCAGYVDLVRKDILEAQAGGLESGKPAASLLPPDRVGAALRRVKVPNRLITEFVEILKERVKLEQDDKRADNSHFLQLADKLNAVHERELSEGGYLKTTGEGQSAYLYSVKMEEALTRMGTQLREQYAAAQAIYNDLAIVFDRNADRNAVVRFRLGWVSGKLGDPNGAIENYSHAKRLIEEATNQSRGQHDKPLNTNELATMADRLHRLTGYAYWMVSQERGRDKDAAQQVANIVTAYRVTEPALALSDQMEVLDAHNNMLYYATDYLSVAKKSGLGADGITGEALRRHLEYLERHVDVSTAKDVDWLDTLCFAYDYLNQGDPALSVANRILELLFREGSKPPPDPSSWDVARRAYSVQGRYTKN